LHNGYSVTLKIINTNRATIAIVTTWSLQFSIISCH